MPVQQQVKWSPDDDEATGEPVASLAVVETGVDPVTFRFSGGRSAD